MRVVVLGGGYAGLLTARKLEDRLPREVDLVVVDDTGHHLVQHELHRVIRRPSFADDISVPLAALTERASVRVANVDTIDRDARTVEFADGERLEYDIAVVAFGAETAYHGIPGLRERSTPLKRLEHATEIRRTFDDVADGGGGNVVVGGAGLSGIQVAGELAEYARESGVESSVSVRLLEQETHVAPTFPRNFRTAVRTELERRDVEIDTHAAVSSVDDDALTLADGGTVAYDQLVWTGGITGNHALGRDRPTVRADFVLDERTFGVGDAVRVTDAEGTAVPSSAQAAVRASTVVAENVARLADALAGGDPRPRFRQWRFDTAGWLVSVGDGAVAQIGPKIVTGPAATVLKSSVGVTYLAEYGSLRQALSVVRGDLERY